MLKKLLIQTALTLPLLLLAYTSHTYAKNEIVFSYPLVKPAPVLSSEEIKAIKEKIAYYDTLIAEFKHSKQPQIIGEMIDAYYAKGKQQKKLLKPHAAIKSYDHVIAAANKSLDPLIQSSAIYAYLHKAEVQTTLLKDPQAAVNTYDTVIAKLPMEPSNSYMASAYLKKAQTQAVFLKAPQLAIDTYDTLLAKYSTPNYDLAKVIAAAYLDKAAVQTTALQDHAAAINTYDALIAKHNTPAGEGMKLHQMITAYLNKAEVQAKSLKNEAAALRTFDALITMLSTPKAELNETLINAYLKKADALASYLNKPQAAIKIDDFLISQLNQSLSSEVKELIAAAYLHKAAIQIKHLNDHPAATTTYEALIAAFYDDSDIYHLRPSLGKAHQALAINQLLLAKQNWRNQHLRLTHLFEANSTLQYVRSILKPDDLPSALSYLGYLGWLMEDSAQAEEHLREAFSMGGEQTFQAIIEASKQDVVPTDAGFYQLAQQVWNELTTDEHVIATFAHSSVPEEQLQVARAYLARAAKRLKQNPQAGIDTYDIMIAQFGHTSNPKIQAAVASAYMNKATMHEEEGDYVNAIETYDAFLTQFSNVSTPAMQTKVAEAYLSKGFVQRVLLSPPDKLAANTSYDTLIAKYGTSQVPAVQKSVLMAYVQKTKLLTSPAEKVALYEKALINENNMLSPYLQESVTYVYDEFAKTNLLMAKQSWADQKKRKALLNQALQHFNKLATSDFVDSYYKLRTAGMMAYTHWLLGHQQKAKKQLDEALTSGGIDIYNDLAGYINEPEIAFATDEGFKTLLTNTWKKQQHVAK